MKNGLDKTKRREPPQRLYAFTDSVEGPTEEFPNRRTSIVFDTVDADAFDDLGPKFWDEESTVKRENSLGVLRVLTTERRFENAWHRIPEETGWLEIMVGHAPGYPRSWYFNDAEPREPAHRLNLFAVRHLDLGQPTQQLLEKACSAPEAQQILAKDVLRRIGLGQLSDLTITALDVGQAACVAFAQGKRTIGYFDVGAPASFHSSTFPNYFPHNFATEGFVVLSHWDMDHYGLVTSFPRLKNLDWYAPQQPAGLRVTKLQRSLGARLHFISGSGTSGGVSLAQATGTNPKDRNATGYIMRLERGTERVLLTGDADYTYIPTHYQVDLTALAMPHHAGRAVGSPPSPAPLPVLARAVASYGNPNRYHHPHVGHLSNLKANGWSLRHTARNRIWPRSDQRLYPLLSPASTPAAHRHSHLVLAE